MFKKTALQGTTMMIFTLVEKIFIHSHFRHKLIFVVVISKKALFESDASHYVANYDKLFVWFCFPIKLAENFVSVITVRFILESIRLKHFTKRDKFHRTGNNVKWILFYHLSTAIKQTIKMNEATRLYLIICYLCVLAQFVASPNLAS